MSTRGRILALDLGSKTLGLAVSDPLGITAQGLPTLKRTHQRADLSAPSVIPTQARDLLCLLV